MKIYGYPLIMIATSALLLAGCEPGPITLGSRRVAVETPQGQVTYVNYKVNKKRYVEVPAGLTGADLTTAKIEAAYEQDPLLKPYKINVTTRRGLVTLSGTVPSKDTKSYAIKVARYTKGVLAVNAKHLVVGMN